MATIGLLSMKNAIQVVCTSLDALQFNPFKDIIIPAQDLKPSTPTWWLPSNKDNLFFFFFYLKHLSIGKFLWKTSWLWWIFYFNYYANWLLKIIKYCIIFNNFHFLSHAMCLKCTTCTWFQYKRYVVNCCLVLNSFRGFVLVFYFVSLVDIA